MVCDWSNLAELVANAPVELPSLYTQEVFSRMHDATLGGDGPGSVYVVSCHHTDGDSSPLALPDGFWYLVGVQQVEVTLWTVLVSHPPIWPVHFYY